jgi:hypothetical protein
MRDALDNKMKSSEKSNTTLTKASNETKKKENSTSTLQGCLGCFGVSAVLLLVAIFIVALVSNNNDQPTVAQQPARPTAISNVAKPGTASEQNVNGIITKAVGKKNNLGGDRVISLKVNDHMGTAKADDKIMIATLLADDAGSSTKSRMQYQAIDLFKELFSMSEIEEVTLIWQFPLVDAYGKVENSPVMKITVEKATASKINWENFNRNNFGNVANAYYEHPAIQNDK